MSELNIVAGLIMSSVVVFGTLAAVGYARKEKILFPVFLLLTFLSLMSGSQMTIIAIEGGTSLDPASEAWLIDLLTVNYQITVIIFTVTMTFMVIYWMVSVFMVFKGRKKKSQDDDEDF